MTITPGISSWFTIGADVDQVAFLNWGLAVEAEFAGKSDVGHGHAIADVTDLSSTLAGKSDVGHGHAIADITGLQAALSPLYTTLSANRTLTSTTAEQAIFEAARDAIAVEGASIYTFECRLFISGMSATSGNAGFSLVGAGSATLIGGRAVAVGIDTAGAGFVGTVTASMTATDATVEIPTALASVAVNTQLVADISGIFITDVAGTIIPSINLATAAAATVDRYSHFVARRIGSSSALSNGAS